MNAPPLVAVVGRPNVGKSSVAAALAARADVEIGPLPFTTPEARELPVEAGGSVLLRLLDTPGLQEAARALHVLGRDAGGSAPGNAQAERMAPDRRARLEDFIRRHATGDEFREERIALQPLLDGASFLLVVDSSRPFRPNHEAEMALLAWTGGPGLAVLHRTRPAAADHAAEWEAALRRHLPDVVRFDAGAATLDDRAALVEALGRRAPGVAEAARAFRAVVAEERRRLRHSAAGEIGRMLVDDLTHADEVTAPDERSLEEQRQALVDRFRCELQDREARARRAVERLYGFPSGGFRSAELAAPVYEKDLFAEDVWRTLGLTPGQLVAAGAASGAATGLAVDAAVGGHSLFLGALVGGVLGASVAAFGEARPRIRSHDDGLVESGKRAWRRIAGDPESPRFTVGPLRGENFPWVLLDRALLHFEAVTRRSHARRGEVEVPGGELREHPALAMARERRAELSALFREIRTSHVDPPPDAAARLAALLEPVLERIESGR